MPVEYEPFSPEWRADPYPVYRELRERDPVHWSPEAGVFCVSRYDDVLAILKDTETFSSRAMFTMLMNQGREEPLPLTGRSLRFVVRYAWRTRLNPFKFKNARLLIAADPPVHGWMRNLVNRGFTPHRIATLETRAREIVAEQMAKLERGEPFDVVRDLAIPLPVTIIAEMLGVEPERTDDFKRWSDTIIVAATGPNRDDIFQPELVDAVIAFHTYLANVIGQRRRQPADDLLSVIIADHEGATTLDTIEVVQFVQLLLVAGNETTTNLIGNATRALLANPGQLELARREPERVPDLVEEAVRYDSPIQILFRKTTRDVELHGTRIPAGATVAPLIGSANRDERRFEDPDAFDVTRKPQGHLGFGFGNHFCLGAALARLEARAALEALVPELSRFQLKKEEPEMIDSFLVRGAHQLDLVPAQERAAS